MTTEQGTNPAARLGIQPGQVVQEVGHDQDADQELREAIEQTTGAELVGENYDDVADAVILWFRKDDGDLADALIDATTCLDEGGSVLLLTPKAGGDGYVEPSEIGEAATSVGLALTASVSAGKDWNGSRASTPQGPTKKR